VGGKQGADRDGFARRDARTPAANEAIFWVGAKDDLRPEMSN
jgi:hypothetical protein